MLSLLAMGSALAIAPDLRRVMVSDTGLLNDDQFNASIVFAGATALLIRCTRTHVLVLVAAGAAIGALSWM